MLCLPPCRIPLIARPALQRQGSSSAIGFITPPLSLVKITRVLSASLYLSSVSRMRPTDQSSSSMKSPYLPKGLPWKFFEGVMGAMNRVGGEIEEERRSGDWPPTRHGLAGKFAHGLSRDRQRIDPDGLLILSFPFDGHDLPRRRADQHVVLNVGPGDG